MKLRRILSLLVVLALCLAVSSPVFAASEDEKFLSSLKDFENYLRANYEFNSTMGTIAEEYLLANFPTMDVERLNACLTRYLGCASSVRLSTKLNEYARSIRSGYKSIYELAILYKITPEAAADRTYMDRSQTAMEIEHSSARNVGDSKCYPNCPKNCNPCNPCSSSCTNPCYSCNYPYTYPYTYPCSYCR